LCERDSLQGDAASRHADGSIRCCVQSTSDRRPAQIIDALFGAGLNRPVKGEPHDMIEAINANGAPVLGVDLPSGINGDTGAVMGVAFAPPRPSRSFGASRGIYVAGADLLRSGALADIGIDPRVLEEIRPDFRKYSRSSGATRSGAGDRRPINTPAAMPWSSPATLLRPARRGWRRAARYELAPDW